MVYKCIVKNCVQLGIFDTPSRCTRVGTGLVDGSLVTRTVLGLVFVISTLTNCPIAGILIGLGKILAQKTLADCNPFKPTAIMDGKRSNSPAISFGTAS